MTVYEIRPYQGAGELEIGMLLADVHAILGKPIRSGKNMNRELVDTFDGISIAYSAETGRVVEVAFSPQVDVRYNGIHLFSDSRVVELLAAKDGAPLEGLGFLVFKHLGIALADFEGDEHNDRAVQIFAQGRLDSVAHFQPYVVPVKPR
jgi:hypothetical protein